MKTTTSVRVVLPTDELVRVECVPTMTVADLVSTMGKRSVYQTNNRAKSNGNNIIYHIDNNYAVDPVGEAAWRSKGAPSGVASGKLTLIRQERELKSWSLVVEEVKELDILEFQVVTNRPRWTEAINCQQHSTKTSTADSALPYKTVEEVRPVSSVLSPLSQEGQNRAARTTSTTLLGVHTINSHPPLASNYHRGVALRKLIRKSRYGWFQPSRQGVRRCRNRQTEITPLLPNPFERRRSSIALQNVDRILLRAGMQLIERLQLQRADVRGLVFLLRDAILGTSALTTDRLLPFLKKMVDDSNGGYSKALACRGHFVTQVETGRASSTCSEESKEHLIRQLSWDIAGKEGGVAVLLEGPVISAEWGAFWRSQSEEYACLCENHILYFFSSRTHCADFVFELGRDREGRSSETSKCLLKENTPLTQIDLSETDWTVRKSTSQGGQSHRHAFAFFDSSGSITRVLDVTTAAEATTWARVISAEINRCRMFARVRGLNREEQKEGLVNSTSQDGWAKELAERLAVLGKQKSLKIPLRSLYAHVDKLSGTARAERYNSWTLRQALKDLQRDRVKINGRLCLSASLEDNILALTLEILRCTVSRQDNPAEKAQTAQATKTASNITKEMAALSFARQVIVCSSRTHGGGDILDMLHLLFGNERFCICPDARAMEPIEINIFGASCAASALSAQITMKMTYRVIPTDSLGPVDDRILNSFIKTTRCTTGNFEKNEARGQHEKKNTRYLAPTRRP